MQGPIVLGALDELKPGERKLTFVRGETIVLFNIEGTFQAIESAWAHSGVSLAGGTLEGALCTTRHPRRVRYHFDRSVTHVLNADFVSEWPCGRGEFHRAAVRSAANNGGFSC